jgi:hypothetical protein
MISIAETLLVYRYLLRKAIDGGSLYRDGVAMPGNCEIF